MMGVRLFKLFGFFLAVSCECNSLLELLLRLAQVVEQAREVSMFTRSEKFGKVCPVVRYPA